MERAKRAKRATMIEEGNLTAAARPGSASRQPSLGGNFGPPHFSAFFCGDELGKANQFLPFKIHGLFGFGEQDKPANHVGAKGLDHVTYAEPPLSIEPCPLVVEN